MVITNGALISFDFGKGELFIGITMLSFSIFQLGVQFLSKDISVGTITFYTNLSGLLVISPFIKWNLINHSFQVPIKYWLLLIISAIIMHGICTLIWNQSIQIIGATKASIFLNLEPFVAMILGNIILGLSVSTIQLIGGFIIISSVVFSTRSNNIFVQTE